MKPRTVALYAPGPNQVRPLVFPSRFLGVFGRFTRVDAAANVADYPPPPPKPRCYCETSVRGVGGKLAFVVCMCKTGKI